MKVYTYRVEHHYGPSKYVHVVVDDAYPVNLLLGGLYDPEEETCTLIQEQSVPSGRLVIESQDRALYSLP